MRLSRVLLLSVLPLLAAAPVQAAEVLVPQASPAAKVGLRVGVTDVEITYHRPGVKGREVWGKLVPAGQVWRLGANDATTISFSHPVKVEGRDVPAGTYALFAIPGADKWTMILNKEAKQWGAYAYKQSEDLLRFDVKPQAGPETEWMTFTMTPTGAGSALAEMAWEKVRVPFRIEVDVDRIVWKGIDEALAGKPDAEAYLSAANYAAETGQRLADAKGWVEKAMALGESYWNHYMMAHLLQKEGKTDEAIAQLDKALALAAKDAEAPKEFSDQLRQLKTTWKPAK